jgi:hypothetical protein
MSQIPAESDDNRSVAASDFVQLDQSDEVPDHHEEQPQFGLHQSLDWTMDMGSTRNYDNELKEHKLMIEKLEVFFRVGSILEVVIGIAFPKSF